jgi:glycosyltransferase involved in cell wall biosynthesis
MRSKMDSKHSISVIIPCYNQSEYLPKAIESVLEQKYPFIEIVVIDDGSEDDTPKVAKSYQEIKYVYQENRGLAASRNTGIKNATGNYLVFLDADDWLLPGGLQTNVEFLISNPLLAFVSGGHMFYFEDGSDPQYSQEAISKNNYMHLLERNYIAMIATVLFQRWVFDSFLYDTSLPVCEDYDLYLKIARIYPIMHHPSLIAVYRIHSSNMSANSSLMLTTVLSILSKQKSLLEGKEEKEYFLKGLAFWKNYYGRLIYIKLLQQLSNELHNVNKKDIDFLKLNCRSWYYTFIIQYAKKVIRQGLKIFKSTVKNIVLKKMSNTRDTS